MFSDFFHAGQLTGFVLSPSASQSTTLPLLSPPRRSTGTSTKAGRLKLTFWYTLGSDSRSKIRCASFLAAAASVSAVFADNVLSTDEDRGGSECGDGEGGGRWRGLKFSICSARGVVAQVRSCLKKCYELVVNVRQEWCGRCHLQQPYTMFWAAVAVLSINRKLQGKRIRVTGANANQPCCHIIIVWTADMNSSDKRCLFG
jgi:hypothetical protein